jgi:O-antigen ligase
VHFHDTQLMMRRAQTPPSWWPGSGHLLLCAFLLILTVAGGGSRSDIMAQVVVRAATGVALVIAALAYPRRPLGEQGWVLLLLMLTLALPLIQLIPLPPALWHALPGRTLALSLPADPMLWRSISIMPSGTINAAMALAVPLATFLLVLSANEHDRLPGFLLALILMSALLGALQFAGAGSYNPLVNTTPGSVVGFFANRNHYALFLAIGCLIAPVWGLTNRRRPQWRTYATPALCALLLLLILASGSRAGVGLGVAALVLGTLIARTAIKDQLQALSPKMRPVVVTATIGVIVAFALSAVVFGRAESVNRALAMDVNGDQRVAALPVVLSMTKAALPFGNGFGSFDVAFRQVETTALLKATYYNHAHSDFLEVIIDGGFPAALVLVLSVGWWLAATIKVWRKPLTRVAMLGKVGSGILLITAGASIVDYPARTPLILAMITIAAVWLARGTRDVNIAAESSPLSRRSSRS